MSDTRNVLKGEEISDHVLRTILQKAGLLNHFDSPIDLKQYASGYSNLTYLIRTEESEYVLRRPPFGAIKRGHDMGREYTVLSALNKHWDKVPIVYFFDEGEMLGAPFYIMEKIDGVIVRHQKLPSSAYEQLGKEWLNTFVELHAFDYKEVGLQEFGRPNGYVDRQIRNWSKQYVAAKTKEVPLSAKVMQWMEDHKSASPEFALIHNDFRYDNVIFNNDNFDSVSAVLDWEMATIGDPLMDLGTTLGYWTMANDPPFLKQGLPSATIWPGNLSRSALVNAYETISGRKTENIVFYYVYGLFKIAVIAQQIFYRYQKGLTEDPKFAGLEKASEGLITMASRAIEKNRIEDLF